MQQQATQNAQNFYGQSIGSLKSQVQNYRSQLQQFSQTLPEGDAQAQIQEMVDSYIELESSIDQAAQDMGVEDQMNQAAEQTQQDRKSTRLNSSHANISYAVFCLKKKKNHSYI